MYIGFDIAGGEDRMAYAVRDDAGRFWPLALPESSYEWRFLPWRHTMIAVNHDFYPMRIVIEHDGPRIYPLGGPL